VEKIPSGIFINVIKNKNINLIIRRNFIMIFEKIKGVIASQLGIEEDEIKLETSFEDLGVDSLDLFQIIIELEEQFNVQIEDAESIKTVEDAVKYIEERVEA
jgi:acyl carrier protein